MSLRYAEPNLMLFSGTTKSPVPEYDQLFFLDTILAVPGINCIKPTAPTGDLISGLTYSPDEKYHIRMKLVH